MAKFILLFVGRLKRLAVALMGRGLAPATQPKPREEPAEVSRMLGLALQGQGQLDLAFEQFRRAPPSDAVLRDLRGLARDFESKQQFSAAGAVLAYIAACKPGGQAAQLPVVAHDPIPGLVLGHYQLGQELGKGAMGVVYRGKNLQNGCDVALKTLALSDEFDGRDLVDARERFFREAQAAGRLQHPGIVTIYGAGEDHGLAFIAMEFLQGADLAGCCKPGQLLPVPTVISIVARVAEALAYAHRQNVVHRDIKPANIMYHLPSDTVKVTDFGIARLTDASKTKTGLVLGTPSFMSPEQLAGKRVDGRSDLYSLGVMLYQMLGGALPFRGESLADLLHKIATLEAPDIRRVRPELSPGLASLVALALRKRPEARQQDGDQWALALRAVLLGDYPIDLEI